MLLDEIINAIVTQGSDDIQTNSPTEFRRFNRFLRQAILDRHICVTKAIGVSFTNHTPSMKRAAHLVALEGYETVGESYPELMLKMHDKLFLDFTTPLGNIGVVPLQVVPKLGENTVPDLSFKKSLMESNSSAVKVLYTNPYVMNLLATPLVMVIHTYYSSGYLDMSKTSRIMEDKIFPFNTDFSLQDYVRILPPRPGDTAIKLRFFNGMTRNYFIAILSRWKQYLETNNCRREEKLWLQQLEH